ncbi:MAG: sulfotransferase family 2 domain-containing protein [Pseudomonadota bacterium]
MIAHKLKTIFIHIPKTAGSSIEVALDSVEKTNKGAVDPRTGEHNPVTTKPEKHYDAVACRNAYGADVWNDYFKFAVVRNPWDRLHSNWWNRKNEKQPWTLDFSSYVRTNLDPALPRRVAGLFLRRYARPQPLRGQVEWLTSANGEFEIDYVIKFESLKEHFAEVKKTIGLDYEELPKILHANKHKEKRNHYSQDYDAKTREIVDRVYAADIERFEYEFVKKD